MHYEIFLDLLFAENLLLNYTILRLSSFLLKRSATRRRSFAAAALGAGYAVLYAVLAAAHFILPTQDIAPLSRIG